MSNMEVSVKLTLAAEQFNAAIKSAQQSFTTALDAIKGKANETGTAVDSAFSKLNIRSGATIQADANAIKAAFATISASATASSHDVERASAAMKTALAGLSTELRGTSAAANSTSFSGLLGGITGLITAYMALQKTIEAVKSIFTTGMGIEAATAALVFATGSTHKAGEEMEWVRAIANKLGLEFVGLSKAYSQLAAASKGTSLEGEKTKQIFESFSKAAAVLKLSVADTDGIMRALGQVMSKGTVQAEELRGQLGDRLPGAFNIMARALGVTTEELNKMLKAGQVSSSALHLMALELDKMTAGALPAASATLQAALNRMKNAWSEFAEAIAKSGLFEKVVKQIDEWLVAFRKASEDGSLKKLASDIGSIVSGIIKVLATVVEAVIKFRNEIGIFLTLWATIKVTSAILAIPAALTAMAAGFTVAETGALALRAAILSIPAVAAFTGGVMLGNLIKDSWNLSEALDEAYNSGTLLKGLIEKLDKSRISGNWDDYSTAAKTAFDNITSNHTATVNEIARDEKQLSNDYQMETTIRGDYAKKLNATLVAEEKRIDGEIAALKTGRKAADIAYGQQQINTAKTASAEITKLNQAAANASAAGWSTYGTGTAKQFKEAEKEAKKAHDAVAKSAKDAATGAARHWAEAQKKIALDHKQTVLDVTKEEQKLVAEKEKIKQQILALEKQQAAEINRSSTELINKLVADSGRIAKASEETAKERIALDKTVFAGQMAGSQAATSAIIQDITRYTVSVVTNSEKAREARLKSWDIGDIWNRVFKSEETANHEHWQEMARAVQEGARQMISAKEQLVTRLKQKLQELETAYDNSQQKIKTWGQTLSDMMASTRDIEFNIKLGGMTELEKYNALVGKASEKLAELGKVHAEAAAKGTQADQETIDTIVKLKNEVDSAAQAVANAAGVSVPKSQAISKALEFTGAAAKIAGDAIKEGMSAEKMNSEALKGKIDSTKDAIKNLNEEIKNLKIIELKITVAKDDIPEVTKQFEALKKLAEADGINLKLNNAVAMNAIDALQTKAKSPTENIHTINPNTAAADAAIARLQRATHSYHTVYVREVKQNSAGGYIQKLADGGAPEFFPRRTGYITGPGTNTSDEIPAMLSNEEFVVKAKGVKKLGLRAMYMINEGILPIAKDVQSYAIGGLVGAANFLSRTDKTASNDIVDINLNIGTKKFQVQSSRDIAMGLSGALRELARGM